MLHDAAFHGNVLTCLLHKACQQLTLLANVSKTAVRAHITQFAIHEGIHTLRGAQKVALQRMP